jgi:2-hydroxy-3-oxopropionate reductase
MDAPGSGGETGAIEGTLSIMVGADRADFDEVKPILDAMGATVVLVGPIQHVSEPISCCY